MNTRKFPRTMAEAFGPYAGHTITEPADRPMDWQDKLVLAASVLTAIFVGILLWSRA